jgi:hypothetical protein
LMRGSGLGNSTSTTGPTTCTTLPLFMFSPGFDRLALAVAETRDEFRYNSN